MFLLIVSGSASICVGCWSSVRPLITGIVPYFARSVGTSLVLECSIIMPSTIPDSTFAVSWIVSPLPIWNVIVALRKEHRRAGTFRLQNETLVLVDVILVNIIASVLLFRYRFPIPAFVWLYVRSYIQKIIEFVYSYVFVKIYKVLPFCFSFCGNLVFDDVYYVLFVGTVF